MDVRTRNQIERDIRGPNLKNLLTVAETAEALNLKISTVRAWLGKRKLPRVNCGRCVRVPRQAVEKFIEANTIPAREDQ
jgi:excisionase family DNA binding protein